MIVIHQGVTYVNLLLVLHREDLPQYYLRNHSEILSNRSSNHDNIKSTLFIGIIVIPTVGLAG
jgi:hypothetical protein